MVKEVNSNLFNIYSNLLVYDLECVALSVTGLWQVGNFLRFPPPIKLTPRYNWNIVESGVKHHNNNSLKFRNQLETRLGITVFTKHLVVGGPLKPS